jgi:hypothetical protein
VFRFWIVGIGYLLAMSTYRQLAFAYDVGFESESVVILSYRYTSEETRGLETPCYWTAQIRQAIFEA